jgi:hypothetical protein
VYVHKPKEKKGKNFGVHTLKRESFPGLTDEYPHTDLGGGTPKPGQDPRPSRNGWDVPGRRKSAVCTGILSKRRVESVHTSPWSMKWNETVLPDCTQCRAAISKQPQDGGGTCVSQRQRST